MLAQYCTWDNLHQQPPIDCFLRDLLDLIRRLGIPNFRISGRHIQIVSFSLQTAVLMQRSILLKKGQGPNTPKEAVSQGMSGWRVRI
jgi:hypothetical protein